MSQLASPNPQTEREKAQISIRAAVHQLKYGQRGREVLKGLDTLLESAVYLDCFGREAVMVLMEAAFGPYTGTTLDAVRNALSREQG